MNSSIKIYNSYLKGTNTLFGSFPIYLSSELNCDTITQSKKTLEDTDELLNEYIQYYILSEESDDVNAIFIFVNIESYDEFQYILAI
jgi:hypothetical protein